jgi:predicted adenylyl cyclase CyaB
MPSNIEIKARLTDLQATQQLVEAIADGPPQTLQQTDTFFACTHGRLKLREIGDGSGELIAYQRADVADIKQSDYEISHVPDVESLKHVLRRALGESVVVEKTRLLYLIGQTRVHLDRVTGLGDFLELEVVLAPGQSATAGQQVAASLLQQFQVERDDLLATAYADMLVAQR